MAASQCRAQSPWLRYRSLFAIWSALVLPWGAQAQDASLPKIEAYAEAFSKAELPPKTQTRVYAWRSEKSVTAQPVNLYLNGRYHTSLLKGGYTEFCLKPGKVGIQSATNDAGQMHVGKFQSGLQLETQAGQALYLRVMDTGTHAAGIEPVSETQALQELKATRLQVHTLSRAPVVQECDKDLVSLSIAQALPPPVTAPALPPTTTSKAVPAREYALQTDALFEFGKAELKAEGFNAIESLIHRVQRDYSSIDRIRVVGYTDAIGPVKLNKKLSNQRAEAVADRLRARGLRPKSGIEAEGRWSLELAKTGCKNAPTPDNKICHAPNRRVVIVIYGARR